jgi:N-acetylmuramoyl-L-alanine amidase
MLVALALLLIAAALAGAFEVVVIDPGHGGIDEGTAWYHVKEKDVTLAVAKRLEDILSEEGIPSILTRDTDTYVSLDKRAEIANRQPHSLLVSIHFNASPAASSRGFATFYFSESPAGRFVAQTIQDALDGSYSTRNHGTASQNYAVLVRTIEPAVLVECGFLSNRAEAAEFASPAGQQRLAEALALGITRAKPVVIIDPPECELAKCSVYAKRLEEKRRKEVVVSIPIQRAVPAKIAVKKKLGHSAAPRSRKR